MADPPHRQTYEEYVQERINIERLMAGKPVAGKPVAGKPVAGKPVAGKPVAGKPSRFKRIVDRIYDRKLKGGYKYYTTQLAKKPSARMVRVATLGTANVPVRGQSKGYGRRGRPKGAYDSRYARFGGVYGYRKYLAQQNRMRLLQAQAQMQKTMQNPQATQMYQQMAQNPSIQPYRQQITPQSTQMPMQPQQVQPQPSGLKLWDSNFMKMDTGQSNAPQKTNPMQEAFNPETPAGTPEGDYYTEPDFFSGKQVLRRRSGDKLFKW
jgi:hypothetical protein